MFDWIFGKNRNDAMKESTSALGQATYDRAYNDALSSSLSKLAEGGNALAGNALAEVNARSSSLADAEKQAQSSYDNAAKKNKYNVFGDGLIGSMLNPIVQVADAGKDLVTGHYDTNKRDVASDLGALGGLALSAIPGAGILSKAPVIGKAAGAIGKAASSIPGAAAIGGGLGVADKLREDGSQADFGDMLKSGAMGAAFGGGIPLAGKALKPVAAGLRERGAGDIAGRYLANNPDIAASGKTAQSIVDDILENGAKDYGGGNLYYRGAMSSLPKSRFGKMALGGGVLGGGMLTSNLARNAQAGAQYNPYEDEELGY